LAKDRVAHGIEEAAGLGLLRHMRLFQLLDAGSGALQRLVLHQNRLYQGIDRIGRLVQTILNGGSRISIAWRALHLGKPVEKIVNQLAFLRCHGVSPRVTWEPQKNVGAVCVAGSVPARLNFWYATKRPAACAMRQ